MSTIYVDEDGNALSSTPYPGGTLVLGQCGAIESGLPAGVIFVSEEQLKEAQRQIAILKSALDALLGASIALADNAEPLDALGIEGDYQVGGDDFDEMLEAIEVARKVLK